MIGRLLLVLAALAASASATGYLNGQEYVYSYKGQIYTGYPRIKPQFSGYAFHANVRIQPHDDYAVLKVDNVQKAQFNGEFENVGKHPHDYKELPAHAQFLTTPFKVYRKNGIVTHFETNKDEPAFSVNLKRGLVALFNLNFDASDGSPSTEANDIVKTDPDAHYYKVYEKGVLGDCETAYVIEHHPYFATPHNNVVLNVTKVRNYHKCHSTPNQVYSVFHGNECGQSDHEKSHTLHGSAQYHYDIRGYRHRYVVEKIKTVGEVAYTPYPIEGQTVATYINRKLVLVEEHPVTDPLVVSDDLETHSSLEFEFEHQKNFKDPVDLKKPHYLYHVTGRQVPLNDIKAQFEELVQDVHDDTHHKSIKEKEFPAKFVELVRAVGTVGYTDIEALYNAYGNVPKDGTTEQKKQRNLFVDTLIAVGTNPAIAFGKHLIENKSLRPGEVSYFLGHMPLHVKEVSETLLDQVQELCDNVKKQAKAHIACVFALSNIIYDHCVARYHPEVPAGTDRHTCQPVDAIKYFDHVIGQFEQATHETLKVAYLKAAANIGLREIIPHIKPYIEGQGNHPKYHRIVAVWAIKNVGFRFPNQVRELLVPLLFNQSESYEYRIAAYNMLLMYRPQLYEFEGLARALKHDHDDQVKSYIYSHIQHVANSTHPCDKKLAEDAHYALRILDDGHNHFDYDYSYSKHHYAGGYDHDYDFGGSTRFAYLASDSGYIPRTMYLGLEDFIGGKSLQTFGVGFNQFGLERFLDPLIGPEGSVGHRSLFDLFKKREKRNAGGGVEKELNEIKGKIDLPTFEYEPIHGEIFLKYMGNNIAFYHFDDSTFENFFKDGRFAIPNIPAYLQKIPEYDYQRFMLTVDKFYVIPSESGIPILFDYKQPIYYHHNNHESSFKVEPGFFPEDRAGKFPDHVKFATDGHIAFDKNLFAYMGVIIPFDQVIFGAGINRRATVSLPLKLKLDLDVKEKQLNFAWTPVAPHDIYHFKYEPYTFIDSYANTVPKSLEPGYLPVRRVKGEEHQHSYFHDTLGVGFDVHSYSENEFNHEGNWLDFLLQKDYREKFYYLYANPHFEPYCVDVKFSHAAQGATKEVEGHLKYTFHDSAHTTAEFAEHNFEQHPYPEEYLHPCTCGLEYVLHGTGDKERKVKAVVEWTRDLKRSFHRVNLFYERTPFGSHETDDLHVCGSGYLKYPKYDLAKVATMDTIGMDHTVEEEIKLRFGKDCSTHQKVDIHSKFSTTEEQRHLESQREESDTPEHYNPYSHYYHEALKERQMGENYGDNFFEYVELISTAYDFDHRIKFENLSPRMLNISYKIGGLFRHLHYNYADHNVIDVNNPEGEIHLHANQSLHLPLVDVEVTKPHSTSHYTNVYMPCHKGIDTYPEFEDIHVKNSFTDIWCKVEGDHVATFDDYKYKLPPFDCYKVIAKDCTKREFFTVLGSKITHPKYHKALKVFIGKHKIEALPVSDDSDIIIRVDGKRVSVEENEPYLQHEEGEHGHHSHPAFYVTKRNFYYAIHSEKYGLIIEYDGHVITVQVAPYYRSKVCGLCGNYNGQKYDSITDENGCYYEDTDSYAYAFSIPTDTCPVTKKEKKCPMEGGFGCTKLKTKIIEREGPKGPETCFSTESVAECASHCKARSTVTQHLSYHCLPSKDDSTKALVRQAQHRVIKEVRRKSADHEANAEVPDVCLKA